MKRLLFLALMGGLSLAAQAQTEADSSVRIPRYQIDLPTKAYTMFAGDFDAYKGAYDLSNGDTLALRQFGPHMFAVVGDGDRKELIAVASNVFISRERDLKITLNRGSDGDFTGEVLMVVSSPATQANAGQLVRLVATR